MKYRQFTIKPEDTVRVVQHGLAGAVKIKQRAYLVQRNGVTLYSTGTQQNAKQWIDYKLGMEAAQYRSTGRRYKDNACEVGMR